MMPSHSAPGAVLFTKMTLPVQFLIDLLFGVFVGENPRVAAAVEDEALAFAEEAEAEDDDEDSCTAFANSLTSFLNPCTLREVPMMISMSGLRAKSADWILPMSSPSGWGSSYSTMAGRSVPTLVALAERA